MQNLDKTYMYMPISYKQFITTRFRHVPQHTVIASEDFCTIILQEPFAYTTPRLKHKCLQEPE